ncbi:MAG: carbohydrate ABC transporter permease [Anaerolineae bacterium]
MIRSRTSLYFLPWLIGTLLLVVIPALATFGLVFQGENGADLSSFSRLLSSDLIRISVFNSLVFIVAAVPLRVLGAFFFALLLKPSGRINRMARTAVFLPSVIPPPAWALIGLWLFNPLYGPINIVLSSLGLPAVDWLVNPGATRAMFVILAFFQLGEGFIVLLIGRALIPVHLFDAARLDGAGLLARFRYITLPLMLPWLALLTGRDLLVSLQGTFTPSFIITYGGPYYSTTFLPLLIYELAFDFRDPALVSAVLLVTFMALAGISLWLWQGVFGRD